MFSALRIKNFRGFREFKIDRLARINLIGGANGVGKSSLLESLYFLLGETNLQLVTKAGAFRGFDTIQGAADEIAHWIWKPLFFGFDVSKTIEISGKKFAGPVCQVKIREMARKSAKLPMSRQQNGDVSVGVDGLASKKLVVEFRSALDKRPRTAELLVGHNSFIMKPPHPPLEIPGYFLAARGVRWMEEDAKLYDRFEVAKQPLNILGSLKILEPRLTALRTIASVGGAILFGDIGLPQMIPLGLMGDGISRLATILLRIASAEHGVVLVDEIENGLHYSVTTKVWEAIAHAARQFDVQVFCSTHSFECVWAAHKACKENPPYDLCYYRLEDQDGAIVAKRLDEEILETIGQTNFEIR